MGGSPHGDSPTRVSERLPSLWVVIHYQSPQSNRKTAWLVASPSSLSSLLPPLYPSLPAYHQQLHRPSLAQQNSQHPHRQSIWVAPGMNRPHAASAVPSPISLA